MSIDPSKLTTSSGKQDGEADPSEVAPPPAAIGAAAIAPRIRRRNRMITSCLECRRRKLKCDKSHPCANCTKFARDCVFLAPALDSASQLKLTEIKEKMGSLERVLEQDVARNRGWRDAKKAQSAAYAPAEDEFDFAPEPEDERELEATPLAIHDAVYDEDADDELMDLGVQLGKLRLTDRIGGFFRPQISEEISVSLSDSRNDRRSETEKAASPLVPEPPTSQAPEGPAFYVPPPAKGPNFFLPGPTYLPPSSSFFFASNSRGASLIDFLPSQTAADHLLNHYWLAVHPLCRVVHRPSFQRRYNTFWDEIRSGIEPTGSLQAIVFAAMFSGVVSMSEDLILRDFAVSKKDLVDNFQRGTETALSRANFLRTTKLETMQAFVMYMIPLCRDQVGRAHSALVGTAIRLAECMGLHKDGSAYGMGAVEIHVRRIVWYELGLLDIRTCEAQGPRPGIREDDFDTKLPLNVDDNDLEADQPPKRSAERWTDMTLTLIRMECNEQMRVIWFDRPRLEKKQISLTALLGKIENFKKIMHERYLPLMDPSLPMHQVARLILNILCCRMHIMVLHRYHHSVSFRIPDRLRQIILTSGTEQLEDAVALETSPLLSLWSWFAGALQQYHTAFLLLAEIFTYPQRREADRIWRIMDYVFEPPAHLSRNEKARLILEEIRKRTGAYRDARKLRAPVALMKRLGVTPPRPKGDLGGGALSGVAEGEAEREERKPELLFPAANGEITVPEARAQFGQNMGGGQQVLPQQVQQQQQQQPVGGQSPGAGSSGGSMSVGMPSSDSIPDDLMADIDWNEWDKLFPPEINTGELDLPLS